MRSSGTAGSDETTGQGRLEVPGRVEGIASSMPGWEAGRAAHHRTATALPSIASPAFALDRLKRPLIAGYRLAGRLLRGRGLRGKPFFLQLDRFIRARLRLRQTEVDGHLLYLDDADSLGLSIEPGYEAFENRLLDLLAANARVILDIGANIGFNTLRFARTGANVFAIEPAAGNVELLRRNLRANGYDRVTVIPKAVSDTPGRLQLYLSEENRGDHRLYPSSGENRRCEEVEVSTVDHELATVESVQLVKMDIQGCEDRALRGMRRLIERSPALCLVTEFWPAGLRQAGSSAREYFEHLRSLGLALYHIDERRTRLVPADLEQILREFSEEAGNHTNLLGIKGPVPQVVRQLVEE